MTNAVNRGVKEGILFGLITGALFAIMTVTSAAMTGDSLFSPFRMFASIVLGQVALESLESLPAGAIFCVGSIVHFVLSAAFGLVYGAVNARFSAETQTHWGRQAGLGLLFGVVLWLVNFQIIARIFYPWFLMTPQFLQMSLHALFFGLPLALMYAGAERQAHHLGHAPAPA